MSQSTQPKPATHVAAPFVVFRTPLLPFKAMQLSNHANCASPQTLPDAHQADRQTFRQTMKALLADRGIVEALYLASPSLLKSVSSWLEDADDKRGQKAEGALFRYFVRMSSRCTPYGLFAGCSLGTVGAETRLTLAPRSEYRRHTRVDTGFFAALCLRIAEHLELREAVRFEPNSTVYPVGGRLRYVKTRVHERSRSYELLAAERSEHVERALELARPGVRPGELAQLLAKEFEVDDESAKDFVGELIAGQCLVPALEPLVTGPDSTGALIRSLKEHPTLGGMGATLEQVQSRLAAIDVAGLGTAVEVYDAIVDDLKNLPVGDVQHFFQVDLWKPGADLTLGSMAVTQLQQAIAGLRKLLRFGPSEAFKAFRDAFGRRYGTREVPLVEVLDEESGIGCEGLAMTGVDKSPLLAGVAIGRPTQDSTAPQDPGHALILKKLSAALAEGRTEIRFEPGDLTSLPESTLPMPDAYYALGSVVAQSADHVARGDYQLFLNTAAGPSGANLLGRFCHMDTDLQSAVKRYLRTEEALHPDAIFAEVVHLPEGRMGNFLLRPCLRDHEIAFLGKSGAPQDQQIPITDLMISVEGNRLVLRSRKLGREIIPRLASAHNYSASANLGVYRFLTMLQVENVSMAVGFSWGALSDMPFLPRVQVSGVVVSRARWRLDRGEIAELDVDTQPERFLKMQALRKRVRLPRFVEAREHEESDNFLTIDLDNTLAVEELIRQLKRQPSAVLREVLLAEEQLGVHGPEGEFVNEFILPFVRESTDFEPSPPREVPALPPVERAFAPGSEWLYAKIYTGTATFDRVLAECAAPIVQRALADGAADRWFFIRYGDEDWHLRLRFHGKPSALTGHVLPLLHQALAPWLESGEVAKLVLDTYDREVERYGGPAVIELAEALFHADSEAVLEIVSAVPPSLMPEARWKMTLLGMSRLLDDLGMTALEKLALLERVAGGFKAEFGATPGSPTELTMGFKYRGLQSELYQLITTGRVDAPWSAPAATAFDRRSERLAPVVKALADAASRGALQGSLSGFRESLLHMHANRLLRGSHRTQEMVIYEFLTRVLRSQVTRAKAK